MPSPKFAKTVLKQFCETVLHEVLGEKSLETAVDADNHRQV